MVLDFEYGVNTGNRFLQFVDNDEEPEDFIAAQVKEEEKQKKSLAKDSKQPTKKVTTKTTTSATTTTMGKTNKENLTSKSTNVDQRRQQSTTVPTVFSDNNNQQTRGDSARGTRGGSRRGGPPYEGAGRGRSQRFNKFEGTGSSSAHESTSFDQSGEGWSTEGGSRGGRGRGGPRRGNFEGGRGRGGRGNFSNRNEDRSQEENNDWQQTSESNFEGTRVQSNRDYDQETSLTERPFEANNVRRMGRGNYRGRSHRNYSDRDGGEGGQEDYRANRRQFDRQPRSFVTGVKPIEKKDGEGAYNWGNPTENPEEHPVSDEITELTAQSAPASKDWAQQMDEAEKQMTLDEYKKQLEAKKRAQQEKVPQFKTRTAGEGEDPKSWQKFEQEYRKKNNGEESDEEEEEGSGEEENESGEELEEEQLSGKKKVITIPLRFKPIEIPRGSANSRFGQRRGGNRYVPDQQRPTSPSQDQRSPSSQYDEQQNSYRGAARGGPRRPNRGSRQGRSNADPNAPALDNPDDFPTLPKQ